MHLPALVYPRPSTTALVKLLVLAQSWTGQLTQVSFFFVLFFTDSSPCKVHVTIVYSTKIVIVTVYIQNGAPTTELLITRATASMVNPD